MHLPEVEAHHRVAVLIDAVAEVLPGFQEKSLNPISVHTRTLNPPCTPCFRVSRVQHDHKAGRDRGLTLLDTNFLLR